jgi:hypothetical protein
VLLRRVEGVGGTRQNGARMGSIPVSRKPPPGTGEDPFDPALHGGSVIWLERRKEQDAALHLQTKPPGSVSQGPEGSRRIPSGGSRRLPARPGAASRGPGAGRRTRQGVFRPQATRPGSAWRGKAEGLRTVRGDLRRCRTGPGDGPGAGGDALPARYEQA